MLDAILIAGSSITRIRKAKVALLKVIDYGHKLRISARYVHGQGLKSWFYLSMLSRGTGCRTVERRTVERRTLERIRSEVGL